MLNLSNAAVSSGFKFAPNYLKVLGTGYYMAYYFFNSKSAAREVKNFAVNPKFDVAHRMWNLLDTNGIKQFYILSLPSVAYRQKFFLKKCEKTITKESLFELMKNIKEGKLNNNIRTLIKSSYGSAESDTDEENNNNDNNNNKNNPGDLFVKSVKKENKQNYVKVKI